MGKKEKATRMGRPPRMPAAHAIDNRIMFASPQIPDMLQAARLEGQYNQNSVVKSPKLAQL